MARKRQTGCSGEHVMKGRNPESMATPHEARGQSFAVIARRQFLRNRLAVGGLVVVVVLATIAVWCPLLATNKPYAIKAVFREEYENAYYSSLDLLQRIARAQEERKQSPAAAGEI